MASSARLAAALAVRVAALLATVGGAAWLSASPRFRALPLILLLIAVGLAIELGRFVVAGQRRLARAIAAWSAGDFADTAAGGDELSTALAAVSVRLRDRARAGEQERRTLAAIVSHAPVPLLAIDGARVELLNHAARRLLGTAEVTSIEALAGLGASFGRDLVETPPGERRLSRAIVDGAAQYLLVSPAELTADGRTRRLVSLQGIQGELDARTIEAWLEMARVLAHEIMSSLTPIVSLTATAAERLAEVEGGEALADAREAVATAARRSDGLMHFVRRYRELAALPPPDRQPVDAAELVRGVATLLRAELTAQGIGLELEVPASAMVVRADRALVEQALINLVRNAADACRGRDPATVWLRLAVTRGGRVALEVADTGPGVPADLAASIFVPFFTTKRGGSGIGLSLAQHVAHAHGGQITVGERPGGGALFALIL
jgi:two-component system nitrogen regulation sensor histidine kinase NtrY